MSLSWAVVFPIVFIINLARVSHILKITILSFLAAMLRPFLAAGVMYIIVVAINVLVSGYDPMTRLVLPVLGGAAVYFAAVLLLDLDGYHEILDLLRSRS